MNFQFDPKKARSNLRKHGVSFADADGIFDDPLAIHDADPYSDEERYIAVGLSSNGIILTIVYTYRGDDVRLISARKATVLEIRAYNEI